LGEQPVGLVARNRPGASRRGWRSVQARFEARFGIPVLTALSASEFAGVIANWSLKLCRRYGAEKRGGKDRASAGVSLRIVDPESHAPLPTGKIGPLEAKVARPGDGWVRTTDLATIDGRLPLRTRPRKWRDQSRRLQDRARDGSRRSLDAPCCLRCSGGRARRCTPQRGARRGS